MDIVANFPAFGYSVWNSEHYSHMTPHDLLEVIGSQADIARYFDCAPSTVSGWFDSGVVPPGRQYEAQVRTAGKLVACACGNAVPPQPTSQ